jgi:TonB family protein
MRTYRTRLAFVSLILVVTLGSATPAAGQDEKTGKTSPAGVTPPHIIKKTEPSYSDEARRAKLIGKVVLTITIGPDGAARNFRVLKQLGLGLDENAMAAVANWRFDPGRKGGQAVVTEATVEVNFNMLNDDPTKGNWRVVRVQFQPQPGGGRPVIRKAVPPKVSSKAPYAKATLLFDVDTQGEATNIQVESASDDGWARDVSTALSKWRFTAGQKDFAPVSVPCKMEFVRGN